MQLGDRNIGPVLLLARCGVTVAVCDCAIALGWLLQPGDGNVGPVLLIAVLVFVRFIVVETPSGGGVPDTVLSNGVFPYGSAP